MIKPWIKLISYFSQNEYAAEAAKLRESCIKYSVEHEIVPVAPFRSWKDGVIHKPRFILETMLSLRHTDFDGFLWVDADAVLVRPLPIGDLEGVQFGATYFQWTKGHPLELLTGTMYFSNEDKTRLFVEEWMRMTENYRGNDTPEQASLIATIARGWGSQILFKDLGVEWTYIKDDLVRERYPKVIPIIEHHQFSRTFRQKEAAANKK